MQIRYVYNYNLYLWRGFLEHVFFKDFRSSVLLSGHISYNLIEIKWNERTCKLLWISWYLYMLQ